MQQHRQLSRRRHDRSLLSGSSGSLFVTLKEGTWAAWLYDEIAMVCSKSRRNDCAKSRLQLLPVRQVTTKM
jgi:hypothetical protein